MVKQLTQAWKTPDGRYFDDKEDARIFMNIENTKNDLAAVHPAFAPLADLMCQYASNIIQILNKYQQDVQPGNGG